MSDARVLIVATGKIGATGPEGDAGAAGAAGSVWRSGTGAPSGALGAVGDWYLNDANGDIYEKTGASTYTLRDNLTGPTGSNGSNGDWSTAQTIRTVSGTTDTPTTSDAGKLVKFTSASAVAVTIDGSLNLSAGQRIDFVQDGTGQLTFTGSGATVKATPGAKTRAQYSSASLVCDSTDVYWLVGDLST